MLQSDPLTRGPRLKITDAWSQCFRFHLRGGTEIPHYSLICLLLLLFMWMKGNADVRSPVLMWRNVVLSQRHRNFPWTWPPVSSSMLHVGSCEIEQYRFFRYKERKQRDIKRDAGVQFSRGSFVTHVLILSSSSCASFRQLIPNCFIYATKSKGKKKEA